MNKKTYMAPTTEVLKIYAEAVLAASFATTDTDEEADVWSLGDEDYEDEEF